MRNVIVKKPSPFIKLYLLPPIVKMLLALGVFIGCSMVGFYVMYQQSKTQLSTVESQKKIIQDDVSKKARSVGELTHYAKNASVEQKRYEALIKTFPPESSVGDLLASITKLGTTNGLRFVYFRPLKSEEHGYYASIPIDISVVGKFHQIAEFLSGIANMPGSVVAVNQFTLERMEKNESGTLTLNFKADLYHAVAGSLEVKPS